MQPTKKWIKLYEQKKPLLTCAVNLDAYFTAEEIAGKKLDRLSIGPVSLPSGEAIVCDPLVFLNADSNPYFQSVPPGEYEVTLAVVAPDESGDCARYAAALARFSDEKTVRYVEALIGEESLTGLEAGEYFGFGVDAGLACICDAKTRDAFAAFEAKWRNEAGRGANLYDDYFSALMADNYQKHPQYQREGGDWLNWKIPGTEYHIPIFQSGFGDGVYPVYFGFDRDGRICSLVVQFIDIETAYEDA